MTAVEFFDRAPIDNIISSLTTLPDKIIFIGDENSMNQTRDVYHNFVKRRNLAVKLEFRPIKNDIGDIVCVLSNIAEQEQDCLFDLTGGADLVLVAMGIVFERYKHKNLQMQRFSVIDSVVTDCDNDGKIIYTGTPEISVEELVALHGGAVRFGDKTRRWNMTPDFVADIDRMWSICRRDPSAWNSQIAVLNALQTSGLEVSIDLSTIGKHMDEKGIKKVSIKDFVEQLERNGLVVDLYQGEQFVAFSYKNEQIKECLTKAGMALELKVLTTANKIGSYTDSMNGVYIDWDGYFHYREDDKKDTENEIDVVLMQGLTSVFVSCKNGNVEEIELYKLQTVAERFGGRYVKKVLIATNFGKRTRNLEHFKQRAEDMGIKLITSAHKLSEYEFCRMVNDLVL